MNEMRAGSPEDRSWLPDPDWQPGTLLEDPLIDVVAHDPAVEPVAETTPEVPEEALAGAADELGLLPYVASLSTTRPRGSWSTSRVTAIVVILGVLMAIGFGLLLLLGVRSMLLKQAEFTSSGQGYSVDADLRSSETSA